MRISTQLLFENGAARLSESQARLQKTQQQIASGRRILTPSDDPSASARALEVTQSQSLNSQYSVNRLQAKSTLEQVEGTLSSVTALLQDVKTAVISASNGVLTNTERGYIATELSGRFQELLGLANSRDAMGDYLFSGFKTGTAPFVQTATGASYQGDSGQQLMQVDATRQMTVGSSGQSVFMGGGQDVFQTLNDLVTLLQTPVVTPADAANLSAGLSTANSRVDLALDNILTVRASGGARLQELDALDNSGDDRNLQYTQILSGLQDLDYNQALTQLSQQQLTLQAAQQSFVKTASLSLFNYL